MSSNKKVKFNPNQFDMSEKEYNSNFSDMPTLEHKGLFGGDHLSKLSGVRSHYDGYDMFNVSEDPLDEKHSFERLFDDTVN